MQTGLRICGTPQNDSEAQNLEIGKDVTNEIARYATAFGAGLLPVHIYYVGSGSWLLPAIKARLTDAAAVASVDLYALDLLAREP